MLGRSPNKRASNSSLFISVLDPIPGPKVRGAAPYLITGAGRSPALASGVRGKGPCPQQGAPYLILSKTLSPKVRGAAPYLILKGKGAALTLVQVII